MYRRLTKKRKRFLIYTGFTIVSITGIVTPIILKLAKTQEQKETKKSDVQIIKDKINLISKKEIQLNIESSNINDNKDYIQDELEKLNGYPTDLKGTIVSIKDSNNEILEKGTQFTILIQKNGQNSEEIHNFIVKRNKNASEIQKDKQIVQDIKNKISKKEIILDKNSNISTNEKLLEAIIQSIIKENPDLTQEDALKIDDDVISLAAGEETDVNLIIKHNNQTATVLIKVTIDIDLKNYKDILKIKTALEAMATKEITISENSSGTIDSNKSAIQTKLEELIGYPSDLKGTTVSIKPGQNTNIENEAKTLIIEISKPESTSQEINSFKVKREKTQIEKDIDEMERARNKLKELKDKIKKTYILISKDEDTSDDAKLIEVIKKELKKDNPTLTDDDFKNIKINLLNINSNETKIMTLTISIIVDQNNYKIYDTIQITVNKLAKDSELIKLIKDKIIDTDITIRKNIDTSNKTKILLAIRNQLQKDNPSLNDYELQKIEIDIDKLDLIKTQTSATLKIKINKKIGKVKIIVRKEKTQDEELIKSIKDKITNFNLIIYEIIDTSNDTKLFAAIKTQLQIENPTLTLNDLAKITDNISRISLNLWTNVVLKITVGNYFDKINIAIIKKMPENGDDTIKNNKNKISNIKNKITNSNLTIPQNANTSNNDDILRAIKTQLQIENPSLTNDDLTKITDNISSLTSGNPTFVTLTITDGTSNDTIEIKVTKTKTNAELYQEIKDKIKIKNLNIVTNKSIFLKGMKEQIIKDQLQIDNPSLTDDDLAKIKIKTSLIDKGFPFDQRFEEVLKIGQSDDYNITIFIKRNKTKAEKYLYPYPAILRKEKDVSTKEKLEKEIEYLLKTNLYGNWWRVNNVKSLSLIGDYDFSKIKSGWNDYISFEITTTKIGGKKLNYYALFYKDPNTPKTNKYNVQKIKNKIPNKTLIIPKEIKTSNQEEVLTAIRNQLQVENPTLTNEEIYKITQNSIKYFDPGKETSITLMIRISYQSDTIKIKVKKIKSLQDIKTLKDIDEIKKEINKITSKEIQIDATSGSIEDNKDEILRKLRNLANYPSDLKGVQISIKDNQNNPLLKEATSFIILLSKDNLHQEISSFTVKRNKASQEIADEDITSIKTALEAMSVKELTINADSGSIDDNKNEIKTKLEELTGYPFDLKRTTVSIKSGQTDILTLQGVTFIIEISKTNGTTQKIYTLFTVKRSKTADEDITLIKTALEAMITKEVIIATPGTITANKGEIKTELEKLNGYPTNLNGVLINIKDANTSITIQGVAFVIEISKTNGTTQEITTGFTVKRTQTAAEIVDADITTVKATINALSTKEVTIAATSGTIEENKVAILAALKGLDGYSVIDLKGTTVAIKSGQTDILTLQGVTFIIEISKTNGTTQEITTGFTVKRTQTAAEIVDADITTVKATINALSTKEVTIAATSGTIEENKVAILAALKGLDGYSAIDLKGTTVSIKSGQTDILTLQGVAFVIEISKTNGTTQEITTGFTVKRT